MHYVRVLQAVTAVPWAILPQKLAVIQNLLAIRLAGGVLDDETVRERLKAAHNTQREVSAAAGRATISQRSVAVLPLVGTIVPRGDMFTTSSGAVSASAFRARFNDAVADPSIGHIIIDIDSPGGQVGGVPELFEAIYDARGRKPITAVANTLAASAAYWAASAADEIVVTPSGEIGSIGVFAMHQDISAYLEQEGVKVNLIAAGKYKTEGNPYEALGEEARAAIQKQVDMYYDLFTTAVARGRGVSAAAVRDGMGQGRVVGAHEAVSLGMADRVATLGDVIDDALRSVNTSTGKNADYRMRRQRLAAAAISAAHSVECRPVPTNDNR